MSRRENALATLAAVVFLLACAPRAQRTLLFLTDFGARDGAVAACKGVMWSVAPGLRVVDVSHEVPPFDVAFAGEMLAQAAPFYPAGTVVVAVVDPGVGSARKALAARTRRGHLLVGPDNGIFTRLLDEEGLDRAVELREPRYWRRCGPPLAPCRANYLSPAWRAGAVSSTFHGRDIFSPAGAHLAAGVPLEALGPPLAPVRLQARQAALEGDALVGSIRYIEDPFGNAVTDIPMELAERAGATTGDALIVELAGKTLTLPFRKTFSDVAAGRPLALPHSRGLLSFSINRGDFAAAYKVRPGDRVRVRKAPGSPGASAASRRVKAVPRPGATAGSAARP